MLSKGKIDIEDMALNQHSGWGAIVALITCLMGQISLADIYYVQPTQSTPGYDPCPQSTTRPCLTLSQYATMPENYFPSNVSLALLAGVHHLDSDRILAINNADYIGMYQYKSAQTPSNISPTMICQGNATGLVFSNIQQRINISGIEALGCLWEISTADQLLFSDISLQDTRLVLDDVTGTILSCQVFASTFPASEIGNKTDGGTSISRSNITISESQFYNGMAHSGVLYVFQSRVSLDSSAFVNNTAHFGGTVYANQSTVMVHNSTFFNNTALVSGGVFFAEDETTVMISNCKLEKSMANYGGAIFVTQFCTLTIHNTTFVDNKANKSGGMLFAERSTINISNGVFHSNRIIHRRDKDRNIRHIYIGGVICAYHCRIVTNNSLFANNTAGRGGVIFAMGNDSEIIVRGSTFSNSTARLDYGGVFYINGSRITIFRSQFHDNKARYDAGVLYPNSSITNIENSTFEKNSAGWGGALRTNGGIIDIFNSTFSHNIATSTVSRNTGQVTVVGSNTTIQNSQFDHNIQGAIFCQGSVYDKLSLANTSFLHNIGNVMYISSCQFCSRDILNIQNNTGSGLLYFKGSHLKIGGSMTFTNNTGSFALYSSSVTFSGAAFFAYGTPYVGTLYANKDIAQEGGALTAYQQSKVIFQGNCQFENNQAAIGGAILASESDLNILENLTIANNTALISGGGISAFQSEIRIQFAGNLKVSSNQANEKGGGIYTVNTKIILQSVSSTAIVKNNSTKGGGIFLDLNSKIYVHKEKLECTHCATYNFIPYNTSPPWISLTLSHNSAELTGGALYHNDDTNTATCDPKQAFSYSIVDECFLQSLALYTVPADPLFNRSALNTHNVYFVNNTAKVAGSALYGGLIDRCSVNSQLELTNRYPGLSWNPTRYFLNITNIDGQDVSSGPVSISFCRNDQVNHSYQPPMIYVKKGQEFNLSLVALDQLKHPVSAVVHSSLSLSSAGLAEGQVDQNTAQQCTNLTYAIYSSSNLTQLSLILNAEGPCKDQGLSRKVVNITLLPCSCPIGFQPSIDPSSCICECDPDIKSFVTNCSAETEAVVRIANTWIGYVNNSNKSGFITYSDCPFDYCHTQPVRLNFNVLSGANAQCTFKQSGKLCGSCANGTSLTFGSSHCKPCSNYWIALVIPFALAGIALVVFILGCNLTVAVGTINGLVFYANIVAANSAIFLPFERPNIVTVFLAWVNLDLGIETCFHDGMDSYVKTWLQLAFPFYIFSLVVIIITVSEHWHAFTRLLRRIGSNAVSTLATLVLLSYAKLLRVIIAALSPARLDYPDGTQLTVWLVDGDINYLKGKHVALAVAVISITTIGILYTLLLFFWQLILRCTNLKKMQRFVNTKVDMFILSYHRPLNPKHRYWIGMLLLARILLFSVSTLSSDPQVILLSVIVVCAAALVLHALNSRIYTNWPLNALDIAFTTNLGIFAAATMFTRATTQQNQATVAYISTGTALLLFTGILFYHISKLIPREAVYSKTQSWLNQSSQEETLPIHSATDNNTPFSAGTLARQILNQIPRKIESKFHRSNKGTLRSVQVSPTNSDVSENDEPVSISEVEIPSVFQHTLTEELL